MRSLFIVLILFAIICIFLLMQRRLLTNRATSWNRGRVKSLNTLMKGQQQSADVPLRQKLTMLLLERVYVIISVFEPDNKTVFVRNIFIPLACTGALVILNQLYIGLSWLWAAPVAAVASFFIFYSILKKKKKKQFNNNFNEALTTISGAISSGRTFLQAMSDYAFMSDTKLGQEFGIIGRRLNLGDDAEKVFCDSWRRYPYREYYFFIVAILLNIRNGGRLKDVLRKLQKTISSGVAMEKKMLTMTSEMRMASKITGAIPFVFLLLLKFISPENFEFVLFDERGRYILYYLLGSEIIGLSVIKYLMRGI